MIVLAFVACLEATPEICRDRNLMFAETMSPQQCLMRAQPELAKWCNEHPGWRIGSWRCGRPEKIGQKV